MSVNMHTLLPHSAEAERAVCCAMMSGHGQALAEMLASHAVEHFYGLDHRLIFEAAIALNEKNAAVDLLTVTQWLRDRKKLEDAGGAANVTEVSTYLPTLAHVAHHSRIVTEKYRLRRIIEVARNAEARAYQQEEDATTLLEEVQGELLEVQAAGSETNSLRHVKHDLLDGLDRVEARYKKRGRLDGLSTGFVDLDRMLDGLKPACVYVIAGRPAMGKTSFGLGVGEHVALAMAERKEGVAIFSIEMTREQVIDRIFSAHAEVTQEKIRRGFLSEGDFHKLNETAMKFAKTQLFIDDTGGLTITKFAAQARRAVIKHKCKLIVIDQGPLMKGVSKRAKENRQVEMNEIMEGIATTAKQLKVPIIVLAQINRSGEERKNARPTMADIKDSGAYEEWAYMVGILYRPIYYARTDEERAKLAEKLRMSEETLQTHAELDVAKHRNGSVGLVNLKFIGPYTRYEDTDDAKGRPLYSNNPELRQGFEGTHGDEQQNPPPEEGGGQ